MITCYHCGTAHGVECYSFGDYCQECLMEDIEKEMEPVSEPVHSPIIWDPDRMIPAALTAIVCIVAFGLLMAFLMVCGNAQ